MKIRTLIGALALVPMMAGAGQAGDVAKGKKVFKRCKSCHAITADDGTKIVKGGKTGPNLYGLIGRGVGTFDGFNFGAFIVAAGAAGIVWDEENLTAYVTNPKDWLVTVLDDPGAKTKMTFKLKKGGEDLAAYLATMGGS